MGPGSAETILHLRCKCWLFSGGGGAFLDPALSHQAKVKTIDFFVKRDKNCASGGFQLEFAICFIFRKGFRFWKWFGGLQVEPPDNEVCRVDAEAANPPSAPGGAYAEPCSSEDDLPRLPPATRFGPDGDSGVTTDAAPAGYKKCHYALSSSVQRKIRRTKRKPPLVYVDQDVSQRCDATSSSGEQERRKPKRRSNAFKAEKGKLRRNDGKVQEASEVDSLLMESMSSSEYARSLSENQRDTSVDAAEDELKDETNETSESALGLSCGIVRDRQLDPDDLPENPDFLPTEDNLGSASDAAMLSDAAVPQKGKGKHHMMDKPNATQASDSSITHQEMGGVECEHRREEEADEGADGLAWDSSEEEEDESGYRVRATSMQHVFIREDSGKESQSESASDSDESHEELK